MHLALVPPLREQPIPVAESSAPSIGHAPWTGNMGARGVPLARAALGFESELGVRLEVALAHAAERVELLELLDPGLRGAVDRIVAELVGGVRAPAVTSSDPESERCGNGALARPVHDPEAFATDPSWRPWEAFAEPPVAAEEEEMRSIVRFMFRGKEMRPSELAALPEARAAGLDRNTIYLRLKLGWDVEKALTTPKLGTRSAASPASKPPPPVPKTATPTAVPRARKAKPSIVEETSAAIRSTVATTDPVELLVRLGIPHELVAITPRGRLVLFTEAAERA